MINSTVLNRAVIKSNIEYPCIMITNNSDGLIVAFYEPKQGQVLGQSPDYNTHELMKHYTNFNMDCFVPFHGKITIEQE